MTLEEYLSRRYGPADTTTRRMLNEALADLIDDLRADGYRVVKLEHCQDTADGYTINYGAWNVLEELT